MAEQATEGNYHARVVFVVRIEPRAGGGAPNPDATHPFGGGGDPFAVVAHGEGVGAKFLAHRDGHRILQVGATRFDHIGEFNRFGFEGLGQMIDDAQQFIDAPQGAQANRTRDGVVGALSHVDVVVGVDWFFAVVEGIAEDLIGTIGQHFVQIHVVAGAGAGLEGVYHKLIGMLTGNHFVGCTDNSAGDGGVEQA